MYKKPSELLPGHIRRRKIPLEKQMKPRTGNNCWKRRRNPRDQVFGLELLKIPIRDSLLFPKFLVSI